MQALLQNEDSVVRSSIGKTLSDLDDRDLVALLPSIAKAIEHLAPSNEMFADGIRLAGLDLLSRLHIREGLPLCVSVIELDRWGAGRRIPKCLESLARYGVHAQPLLPQLREMRTSLGKQKESAALFDKTIAQIEATTESPTLLDLKEFRAN